MVFVVPTKFRQAVYSPAEDKRFVNTFPLPVATVVPTLFCIVQVEVTPVVFATPLNVYVVVVDGLLFENTGFIATGAGSGTTTFVHTRTLLPKLHDTVKQMFLMPPVV